MATPSASLLDLLEGSVARHGARPLFLTKTAGRWVETTYSEFARLVDAVRGGLAALGIQPGDAVGLISTNRLEWAAVAYASYGLRAAVVPMYESQREDDWAFVIRDANVRVLFVSNAAIHRKLAPLAASFPGLRSICVFDPSEPSAGLTFAGLLGGGAGAPAVRPTSEDVAALLYTSGTTGQPKGVVLTHGNVVSNITTVLSLIPVSEQHRTLSFLPWAHAFGHTLELHGVIAMGASTALAESVDKIVDNLSEIRPTTLFAVPRVFLRVYAGVNILLAAKPRPIRWLAWRGVALARRRSAGQRLSWLEQMVWRTADRIVFRRVRARVGGRLQFAISGAAALPLEVAEMIDGLGIEVYEGYGLTETSPIVSANVPGHRKLGSVGRPLPGVRVVIDTTATGAGQRGEIVVYGPNVMRGYHNRPEETRAILSHDGGLRTGDLGYLDGDGYLYITGRIKEQYKLANGKYVSPGPLEERLKVSPFIADVMIHGDGQVYNIALVAPDLDVVRRWAAANGVGDGAGAQDTLLADPRVIDTIAAEIQTLSREFRGYERIAAFALLPRPFTQEDGMLTPTLKLKRREIVTRWGHEIDRLYTAVAAGPAARAADVSRAPGAAPAASAMWVAPSSEQRGIALD
jgi:long-chain acyl-CoA synthetase